MLGYRWKEKGLKKQNEEKGVKFNFKSGKGTRGVNMQVTVDTFSKVKVDFAG